MGKENNTFGSLNIMKKALPITAPMLLTPNALWTKDAHPGMHYINLKVTLITYEQHHSRTGFQKHE